MRYLASTNPRIAALRSEIRSVTLGHNAWNTVAEAWITVTLSVTAVVLQFGDSYGATLQYSSAAGSWWQLLTCHLTHWNFDQLYWDVAAFFALGVICERASRRAFVLALLLSALAIPPLTTSFYPQIDTYRGLSGVDSALFVLLACQLADWGVTSKDRILLAAGLIAWLVFLGKAGFEAITHSTLFVTPGTDFVALPAAHLVGAVAGTCAWLVCGPLRTTRWQLAKTLTRHRDECHSEP